MPRKSLPQSVCTSAAASVVACTAGLTSDSAEAAPVWIDAPHVEATYQTVGGFARGDIDNQPQFAIDFDQDGLTDYFVYYYFNFNLLGSRSETELSYYVNPIPTVNSTSNSVFSSATESTSSPGRWTITPDVASSLTEVYDNAILFIPLPYDSTVSRISPISLSDSVYAGRSFWSGTFQGGDGRLYVGYLDFENVDDSGFRDMAGDGTLTIYNAGYALIPEPSSLALLGLGGLLLGRRRRG